MLTNQIVLITGASSGIGAACAEAFAAQGAKLLLCSRRLELLESQAAALQKQYSIDIYPFELDVRNSTDVIAKLGNLPKKWQEIDILINNAGLSPGFEPLQVGDIQDWDTMIDTNVKGLLYVTRTILPGMVARNRGYIFNLGSIAGHEVYPNGGVYIATKHAVNALTRVLRMDLFGTAIRVTSIDPGAVETNFSVVRFKGDKKRAAAVYEGMQALQANDIADAIIYCAKRPSHVNISEMIIMPTTQAGVQMISREQETD